MNNWFTHFFMVENGGESKSYNDDDKHWGEGILTVTLDATIVVEHNNEAEA